MVYRVFVEKKEGFASEASSAAEELRNLYSIKGIEKIRIINRYDAEDISEELFETAKKNVFSEPQIDNVSDEADIRDADFVFAVEFLPGQFDQRADSAAQCIQIISAGIRPIVKTAKIYAVYGELSEEDKEVIRKYVINPVESREATFEKPETLKTDYEIPTTVKVLDGFTDSSYEDIERFIAEYGLAMDSDDLKFCREYFKGEKRNPTITEIRMIDTYWSDHCRHTTFLTNIDKAEFEDEFIQKTYEEYLEIRRKLGRTKPVTLMDIGTIAAKYLKRTGDLKKLDESEEINACTVKIKVNVDGKEEDWLLLFKNETHNHPTEIEPFGGAATCIGGAIRDPLSGRSYVYAAMRVTGAADPTVPVSETLGGKLPQRKIVTTAAAGYSSYGNQIGLATGQVDELYHPGYAAKRMEIGAVIAAAPAENVRRECPEAGDIVILLGGRTGRDGCGGATGSSKSHNASSLTTCGAEVQKGNAPEERKLQRLFRNKEASRLIKRCNDFGAGGVSVAVGELADGLLIDLNAVPKKYEGLDGTELAISESQERMAVVVEKEAMERFIEIAESENLEATVIAEVISEPRLIMKWNGTEIVNISREFLNSNGAEKHADVKVLKSEKYERAFTESFTENYKELTSDLNVCSKRGLSERFDSTIGAGTVVMPFGGKNQLTPSQAMVNKISVENGETDTCSFMAWGYNPYLSEKSPYIGAYNAVVESVSKLIASGADRNDVYLTFQEYFEKPMKVPTRFGKPCAALLGAFKAQMDLKMAAIGGKDSMSGTFEKLDVPPTLVSFAVTTGKLSDVVTNEFKAAGNKVILLTPDYDENSIPVKESLFGVFDEVTALVRSGRAKSVYTLGFGGVAEAVFKMAIGNNIGFKYAQSITNEEIFSLKYGAFVVEIEGEYDGEALLLGETVSDGVIAKGQEVIELSLLLEGYENKLEGVFPCNIKAREQNISEITYKSEKKIASSVKIARPKLLIPVFPGTNCEYDTAAAARRAGADAEIFVINNLSAEKIAESAKVFAEKASKAQIIVIPGGFSGGDEPDGSGKFITAFFRNAAVKEEVNKLLKVRDGLMLGICNGFQALIKLGLVPYGEIIDADENAPTLTYNEIGRHQSMLVRTRIASNKSPWLYETEPGEVYTVPISHGEGRFIASPEVMKTLIENGQIATQYCDSEGRVSSSIDVNPNGSIWSVEGITSPDGRVLGKMGHSERISDGLYKNVEGNYDMGIFRSAVKYFK